ncbi:MAG TPA: shikimate dehydrogenase, partial [Chitinophagales bacterium]
MVEFGLIGKALGHSFSKNYFTEKFQREKLPFQYDLFELKTIDEFPALLRENAMLRGLNVTIPYKTQIIPFLDELDEEAEKIGAVNTIKFTNGKTKGFNTDVFGFEKSLHSFFPATRNKTALIFGTGGASLAAKFVLEKNGFKVDFVSRSNANLSYKNLNEKIISETSLFVNCTPVGTFPHIDDEPLPLPYELFSDNHFYFDMIYNPA